MVAIATELQLSGPIHLFLSFPGRLDPDRLARAARLLVDAEPVLGCKFELAAGEPLWRRHPAPDTVAWFEAATMADHDAAVRDVLRTEEPLEGRNLVVRRLALPKHDLLAISVSHVVADGFAAFECAYQLAALYTALRERPEYRPEANAASRDSFEWAKGFKPRHHLRTLLRDLGELRHARATTMGVTSGRSLEQWRGVARTSPDFALRRLRPEQVAAMDKLAAEAGSTRFAVLLAGLARAFSDFVVAKPGALFRVLLPSNMRRFAPGSSRPAIGNMAAVATLTFDPARDASFAATLGHATQAVARLARGLSGAMNPLAAAALRRLSYSRKRRMMESLVDRSMGRPAPPTFTNVGRLNERRLRFDDAIPEHAMILSSAFPLPLLLITGLEYRRTLTLAAAFQCDDLSPQRARSLLDGMVEQIPLGSRP